MPDGALRCNLKARNAVWLAGTDRRLWQYEKKPLAIFKNGGGLAVRTNDRGRLTSVLAPAYEPASATFPPISEIALSARVALPGSEATSIMLSPALSPEHSVASKPTIAFDLRREPGAGKLHAGICGGGVE